MSWIAFRELSPKEKHCVVMVKTENDKTYKAWYHVDMMGWLAFYNHPISSFVDYETHEFINAVTHWKYLEDKLP